MKDTSNIYRSNCCNRYTGTKRLDTIRHYFLSMFSFGTGLLIFLTSFERNGKAVAAFMTRRPKMFL